MRGTQQCAALLLLLRSSSKLVGQLPLLSAELYLRIVQSIRRVVDLQLLLLHLEL
jgi:hypothetical protein